MRADILVLSIPSILFGLVAAHAIERRDPPPKDGDWKPKTRDPHFFNLKVNDRCDPYGDPPETSADQCPFEGYAIRLEKGIVVATPYRKWYDPKLATFFVDDDTQLYTVSKDPLQLYIDAVTGAFKYTKVGWLPPSAISTSFYHTGNNPLGLVDKSPSFLTWPSTFGIAQYGEWALCPLGETGQFQVFVNNQNFDSSGVEKDYCKYYALAAVNANPWKKQGGDHGHHGGDHWGHHSDGDGYGKYDAGSEASSDADDAAEAPDASSDASPDDTSDQ